MFGVWVGDGEERGEEGEGEAEGEVEVVVVLTCNSAIVSVHARQQVHLTIGGHVHVDMAPKKPSPRLATKITWTACNSRIIHV